MGISAGTGICKKFVIGIKRQIIPVICSSSIFAEFKVFLIYLKDPLAIFAFYICSGTPDAFGLVVFIKIIETKAFDKSNFIYKKVYRTFKSRLCGVLCPAKD